LHPHNGRPQTDPFSFSALRKQLFLARERLRAGSQVRQGGEIAESARCIKEPKLRCFL
jgi:hypothetical protein